MQKIPLGQTGRSTTRLGFGCSSVMGALGRNESLAMLEAAFDAGIRHFDVAPMYGYGEAEGCLGEFLVRHPGEVTVTTKYGIPAEPKQVLKSLLRGVARPVVKLLPGIRQRLAAAASSVPGASNTAGSKSNFTAAEARASLDHSLAELKTGHIDLYLLHEAEAADLQDESLLRLLEDSVAAGKIGSFGVGSGGDKIAGLLAERPTYCSVLQYEWSVLNAVIPQGAAFRLHHRALTDNFRVLHAALVAKPETCRAWSEQTGENLADAETLAHLMLKASLEQNAQSVILFSSKRPAHIVANVKVAEDQSMAVKALRLYDLVQADHRKLLAPAGVVG